MNIQTEKPRKHCRLKISDTFMVDQEGVCQVLDLSTGGVSFGCITQRNLPETWTVDIVSNSGNYIWNLPVKTIWAETNVDKKVSSIHRLIIGARILEDLAPDQEEALKQLLGVIPEEKQ